MAVFCPSAHVVQGAGDLFGASFVKGTDLIHEHPTLGPNHLPEAPAADTDIWGIRFQHMNWGGGSTDI